MTGVPLNIPSYLFQAIENLALNTSARYVDTFLSKDIEVSNKSTLIAEIPINEHTYLTRIRNNSDETITLSLGKEINENLTDNNVISPFTIQPKSTFSTENIRGKLYAVAPNNVILKISILSEIIELKEESIMDIPLIMKPYFKTYTYNDMENYYKIIGKWSKKIPATLTDLVRPQGTNSIPGHYIMYLSQFQATQEYTITFDFNLKEGFDSGTDTPFTIYVIPLFSVLESMFTYCLSTQEEAIDRYKAETISSSVIGAAKENNQIGSYSSGVHDVTMSFTSDSKIIHVEVDEWDTKHGGIITDYDPIAQKITIGDY